MTPRPIAPLAAALILLSGCAAAPPPPREEFDCRVIPTGMVECTPRQPDGAAAGRR
jgi:hypothetical protein